MAVSHPPPNVEYTHQSSLTSSFPTVIIVSSKFPISLRTLLPDDVPFLTSLLTDSRNTADDLSVSTLSTAEIRKIIHEWLSPGSPLQRLNFLVLESGVPIGISGYGWIGPDDEGGESRAGAVGIAIVPEKRGKGYAIEAVKMSIDYGLRELGLSEVRIGTSSKNMSMVKLMRKLRVEAERKEEGDKFGNDLIWKFR